MEQNHQIVTTAAADAAASAGRSAKSKKKNGPVHMIRAALFLMRRPSKKGPIYVDKDVEPHCTWTKMVGSMRPLHLQDSGNSPRAPHNEHYEDVFPPPSPSVSDGGVSSRYASAQNLQELDRCEEEKEVPEPEPELEEEKADEEIDTKAEEFIAQFYKNMGLQRIDSIHRHNRMAAKRNNKA